jgi:hypothetical protein
MLEIENLEVCGLYARFGQQTSAHVVEDFQGVFRL